MEEFGLLSSTNKHTVVKEFYTNARSFGDCHRELYTSYVRGKTILYDAATINRFLGT